MRLQYCALCLSWLLSQGGQAHASPTCAASISELRLLLEAPNFSLLWEEISMDDGKPLRVSIREKDGLLWLDFVKAREGLWAQSAGVICRSGHDFETRFGPEQIRLGPAAHWLLRVALANGGKFTLTRLGSDKIRIAGGGWSGTFLPGEK